MTSRPLPPPRTEGTAEDQLRGTLKWMFELYKWLETADPDVRLDALEATVEDLQESLATTIEGLRAAEASIAALTADVDKRLDRLENAFQAFVDLGYLTQTVYDPPTADNVKTIQDKVNKLIEKAQLPAL